MTEEKLYMVCSAHRLLADTVMRYRQLRAGLGAIVALDWERIKEIAVRQEAEQPVGSEWDDLFDSHKSGRYSGWFEENFREYPATLRRLAVDAARHELVYRRPSPQKTLRELLTMKYRSELQVYFSPDRGGDFAQKERGAYHSIRLQLYDAQTRRWEWRKASFGRVPPQFGARQENGVEMTPVPETLAKVLCYSKGELVAIYSRDELLVEPVLEALPFANTHIPASYFSME
jgi:hypothetical protein